MKDYLQDLVHYTYGLGVIELVKVNGTDKKTVISAIAEDKSVVVEGTYATPVADFIGTFGMPQLNRLKAFLTLDEYDENAKITVVKTKDGTPTHIHFESQNSEMENDYRFMAKSMVEEKVKDVTFRGATWNVEFEPTVDGINRLKRQAAANSEETSFTTKTEKGDLKISFADPSVHSGKLTFHSGVNGTLTKAWQWPVKVFLAIMDLPGDKKVKISDMGAAEITVDSGLAVYRYLLPAKTK